MATIADCLLWGTSDASCMDKTMGPCASSAIISVSLLCFLFSSTVWPAPHSRDDDKEPLDRERVWGVRALTPQ